MKNIKKLIKCFSILLSFITVFLFVLIVYGNNNLPNEIKTVNSKVIFSKIFSVNFENNEISASATSYNKDSRESQIKLFGAVPVKEINFEKTERKYVAVGGELIGIRLKTQGVLVVGTESFESQTGTCCPAKEAGIEIGDTLISLDDKNISNNMELSQYIENSNGDPIKVDILRNGVKKTFTLTPKLSTVSGLYKSGLWIRDSTGGIGTLTYIDFNEGTMASLGHGIYDVDTEALIPAKDGAFYSATLNGVTKGSGGNAGELKGFINDDYYFGSIYTNCENGIFGEVKYFESNNTYLPVATNDEIKPGKAQIISTVDSNGKQYFDIEIEKIIDTTSNKNMIIKITDDKLLKTTGGIVQGMSGSPIIQNGMLVGAVTHVFLNEPEKGYGIFIDNMLSADNQLNS